MASFAIIFRDAPGGLVLVDCLVYGEGEGPSRAVKIGDTVHRLLGEHWTFGDDSSADFEAAVKQAAQEAQK